MDVVITNPGSTGVYVRELYHEIPPGTSVTRDLDPGTLAGWDGLTLQLSQGLLTISITPTADELAAGILASPLSVQAVDLAAVDVADVLSPDLTIVKAFTALTTGSADDVTIYAANSVPFKMQILDMHAFVTTPIGGSTLQLYDQAAAAGQLAAQLSSASGVLARSTLPAAPITITPGTLIGMFIHRSDRAVAGTVVIRARRLT